jgi:hypothetical protein
LDSYVLHFLTNDRHPLKHMDFTIDMKCWMDGARKWITRRPCDTWKVSSDQPSSLPASRQIKRSWRGESLGGSNTNPDRILFYVEGVIDFFFYQPTYASSWSRILTMS